MDVTQLSYRNPNLYTGIVIIGILIIALILIIKFISGQKSLKKNEQKRLLGYGAMWMVRDMKAYKIRRIKYYVLSLVGILGIIISLIGTAQLMARPSYTHEITTGVKKRDIFLCLDVSYSLYGLNYDFVEKLEDVVRGLDGDRIGISIYNTTSVLFMPMTDDKEFAVEKLEELKEYFVNQKIYKETYSNMSIADLSDEEFEEYLELANSLDYFEAGTLVNNTEKGSSLIGEGLATCLYNFPSLDDDERTRVILMVTDNAQNAFTKPSVELKEAAGLCSKNGVTVFGVFPPKEEFDLLSSEYDYETLKQEMKDAVESTGGAFYVVGSDFNTSSVVSNIQKHEAMQVDEISMTKVTDMPFNSFVICFVGLVLVAVAKGGGV